jgi:hypothetical protein
MSDYIKDISIPDYIILYQDTDPDDYSPVWSTQSEYSLSVEDAGTHLTGASEDEDEDTPPPVQKKIKIEGDPHSCYYCWHEPSDHHSAHCWLTSTEYDLYSTDDETNKKSTIPTVYYSSLSFGGLNGCNQKRISTFPDTSSSTVTVYSATNKVPSTIKGILRDPQTRATSTVVLSRDVNYYRRVTRSHTRATGGTVTFKRDWSKVVIDKPRNSYSNRIAGNYKGAYSGYVVVPLYTKFKSLVVNQVLGHVAYGNKVYYYYSTEDYHEEAGNVCQVPAHAYLWVRQCKYYRKFVGRNIRGTNSVRRYQVSNVKTPETHEASPHIRASKQVTHLYADDYEAIEEFKYSYWQPTLIYERASIFSDYFSRYRTQDFELYVSLWYYNKHHTEPWMRMSPYDWKYRATEEDYTKRRQWIYNNLLSQYIYRKPCT